jgi:hypothetical protein
MLPVKLDISVTLEYCHPGPGLTVQFTVVNMPRQQ